LEEEMAGALERGIEQMAAPVTEFFKWCCLHRNSTLNTLHTKLHVLLLWYQKARVKGSC